MHYIDCMHDFDWCATRSKRVENTVKAQWTRGHVLNSGQLRRPDGSSGGFYARCVPRLVLSSRLDPRVRLRSATKSSALHLELFDVHEHSLAHILCGRSRRRSPDISHSSPRCLTDCIPPTWSPKPIAPISGCA